MIGSSVIEALEGERVSLWIATAGCTHLGCTVEFDAADTSGPPPEPG
jgi:Rieske Fe-S protein